MAKKQVALVLSGGSSLGAYMSGALDELLKGFAAAADAFEIDIITGASAGATTSALIAHGLLYRGGQAALHDIWVDSVDMVDLLAPDVPTGVCPSVLNWRRLQELAAQSLAWPSAQDQGTRAAFCAPNLTVAMTITNTSSLPYVSRIRQPAAGREEPYVQYRNAEQETFYLGSQVGPTDPIWQRIGTVARASAAIPFVFPLVQLARRAGEPSDDTQYIQKPSFSGEANFWYADGGTFNNLPVDLAWYHIRKRDSNLDDRVVVVVNPWHRSADPPDLNPPYPGFIPHALGMLSAVMRESSALQFQNEIIFPSQGGLPASGTPTPTTLPADGERALVGVDPAPVNLLGNFALVMPQATDSRLHGNHLHALGAFLDRRFREYDFRRGAADARRMLQQTLQITYDAARPAGFYDPDGDPALPADLSTYAGLDGIPSARDPKQTVRQVFEGALGRRIDALIKAWNMPGPDLVEDPIAAAVIKRLVFQQLPAGW
jgi:predicted acylesterase/phospholipase RssA